MDTRTTDTQMDPNLRQDFEQISDGELQVPEAWGGAATEAPEEGGGFPEPPRPAELDVMLPGGIFQPDGTRLRKVEVRELNGADEERLSRAKDIGAYKRLLLELGVERIEERQPTKGLLGEMLMGDRDHLIVAIRRATFGDTMEFPIVCRNCKEEQEIEYHFVDDLPIREFEGESEVLAITLRDGRKATVSLPTAADEDSILASADNSTISEGNSQMLQRIVIDIDGVPITSKQEVLNLGMADRRKILDEVYEHRVGPQFDEVTYECARCGEGGPVILSVFEMFR